MVSILIQKQILHNQKIQIYSKKLLLKFSSSLEMYKIEVIIEYIKSLRKKALKSILTGITLQS